MGKPGAIMLSGLVGRDTLTIYCEANIRSGQRCGHSWPVDIEWAIRMYGDMSLPELKRRLRCVNCKQRKVSSIISPLHTGGMYQEMGPKSRPGPKSDQMP